MKKIVLASALAFASFAVNAQSTNPSTAERSEDDANLYITMNLHNWIDIDNENTSLTSSEPNSWSDLNNGWTVGNAPFNLSATRKCKVTVSSSDVRETGHMFGPMSAGWGFSSTYLSLEAGSSTLSDLSGITVHSGTFSDNWIQRNNLSSSEQDCYTSNEGMYVRHLVPSIGAFKHSTPGTYYSLNLHGGTYKATVTFSAYLQ